MGDRGGSSPFIRTTMGYRQAVRHKTLTLARASSNLATPANIALTGNILLYGGYSSVGRAPDCGSGCRGFKSLYPPHSKAQVLATCVFCFKNTNCRVYTWLSRFPTKPLRLALWGPLFIIVTNE